MARSAIAGRWVGLFSVWKPRAIGRTSEVRTSAFFDPTVTESSKVNGLGLFTGQIGYAWGPALLYFKGGAAVAGEHIFLPERHFNGTRSRVVRLDPLGWLGRRRI